MDIRRSYLALAVMLASILVFSCDLDVNNAYNGDPLENATYEGQNYCIGYSPEVSNKDIINSFLKDLKTGRGLKLLSYLANDIEWTVAGNQTIVPLAGTYNRIIGVIRYLQLLYHTVRIDDLVTTTLTEVDASHLEAYIRLQGKIYSTQRTIDIEFLYTWQMNAKHKIEKITVSYPLASLELAFTAGGKGKIVSDLQASQEAIAITNSFLPVKKMVETLPYETIRAIYDKVPKPPAIPEDGTIESVLLNGINGEIVRTPGNFNDKIILYLHGGAFASGFALESRLLGYTVAKKTNIPFLSIDFRHAAEDPFPAGLQDCYTAYKELLNQYDANNIVLIGSSSGGNLIFSLMMLAKIDNIPLPAAVIGISPWLDLTNSGESMTTNNEADTLLSKLFLDRAREWYLKDTGVPADDPLVSPLFGDVSNLPPMYLTVGSIEVLLSDSMNMFNLLSSEKNDVTLEMATGLAHVWPKYCLGLPDAERTLSRVSTFIKDKLHI